MFMPPVAPCSYCCLRRFLSGWPLCDVWLAARCLRPLHACKICAAWYLDCYRLLCSYLVQLHIACVERECWNSVALLIPADTCGTRVMMAVFQGNVAQGAKRRAQGAIRRCTWKIPELQRPKIKQLPDTNKPQRIQKITTLWTSRGPRRRTQWPCILFGNTEANRGLETSEDPTVALNLVPQPCKTQAPTA